MIGFSADEEFHRILARLLTDPSATESSKDLLLSCLSYLEQLPAITSSAVGSLLKNPSRKLRAEAIRIIVNSSSSSRFLDELKSIATDPEADPLIRVTSLEGIAGHSKKLSNTLFAVSEAFIGQSSSNPEVKRQAARALSHVELTRENQGQGEALARLIASATPFHLSLLLEPFQRLNSAAWPREEIESIGSTLSKALRKSPGRRSLREADLAFLAKKFTKDSSEAYRIFQSLIHDGTQKSEEREQRLSQLLAMAQEGNASRGRVLFHTSRSTCSLCHRVESEGGTLGPNLSKIGAIRSAKDLFEAILFPSATVVNGFESYLLTDSKGETHTGLIHRETTDAIYLRQINHQIIRIPRDELKTLLRSPVSLMPAGLDGILSDQDLVDLAAYLQVCK